MTDSIVSANQMAIIIILAIWTIPWKAMALWRAARNSQKIWFIVLLIINTIGILEILYIFLFSKKAKENQDIQVIR